MIKDTMSGFVQRLSAADLRQLLACARKEQARRDGKGGGTAEEADGTLPDFEVPDAVRHLTTEELARVEDAFRQRLEQSRNGRQRLSRLRLWLVFLLLRYAGLRLAEALAFDDREDVLPDRSVISVKGTYAREVPLSSIALGKVRETLAAPEVQGLRGQLARLDEGYLRRCFYARAKECGLPARRLSARVLRNSRAIELCRGGMPLRIVHAFLGQQSTDRTAGFLQYSAEDAKAIIHHFLHKEMKMKTSARNVFPGRITAIIRGDILVEVRLMTFTGLEVVSIITEQSRQTLDLCEGKTVIATVKAPWVVIGRPDEKNGEDGPLSSARNCYPGVIAAIRSSDVVSEVLVDLPEGSKVCALVTSDSAQRLDLKVGDAVAAMFKGFSVILALE